MHQISKIKQFLLETSLYYKQLFIAKIYLAQRVVEFYLAVY